MSKPICALLITAASPICTLSPAQAQAINFEDRAAGARIDADYGSRGVIFSHAYVDSDAHAHSGTKVLRAVSPADEVFQTIPLRMTFTGPTARVAFFAGNYPGVTGEGTLKVFDSNNVLLGQDGPKPVPNNGFTQFFEVRVASKRIARAEFEVANAALASIDDLTIEGSVGTLPTNAPTVKISNPPSGVNLPEGSVPISGTVTGDSLLDPLRLQIRRGLPPDSTAPPIQNDLGLTGSGATRSFSLNYPLVVGPYTLTAYAKNMANLEGSASVSFTVLPPAIQSRFASSGGAATFGAVKFGSHDVDCVMAIYDKGLIAAVGGQTFVVQGRVFSKWMSTRPSGAPESLVGCPTAEERDALAGARAQDFRKGRIYTTAATAAYVPGVFRDAIETLGGEATTGVALSDPTDSTGAMQTWLFQRFARLDLPGVEASTLEIRGAPAVLYVERVGEGLDGVGLKPNGNSATVYRKFPCNGNLGPCQVKKPEYDPPLHNEKCVGTYPVTSSTEWQSLTGKYVHTPAFGWVHESKMACKDNPLTHDHIMTNNSSRCSTTDTFPSDWNISIRPMAGFGTLTTDEQTYMEIEFEAYYAGYFFAGWGWPIAGDLLFTSGRWIKDCAVAHGVKAEIHPPYLVSHSRMRKRQDSRLETLTEIWVNGHYPGAPIDFDIWAPPRPSPNAFLTITKPTDASAAYGVNLVMTTNFTGAHLQFTAPFRQVPIDESGKVHWMTGRGYEGEWTVGWATQ